MTSTFPTSRSSSQSLKNGLREIQHKKETLMTLQMSLKKRIDEFRELCLKEGELTGHLPVDYPLQPREPIPQVRRRMTRSNGNIPNELLASNTLLQTALRSQSNRLTPSSTSSTISAEEPLKMRLQSIEEPARLRVYNAHTIEQTAKLTGLDEVTKIQPFYEETKPFQMTDFYKYSSKLKQQSQQHNGINGNSKVNGGANANNLHQHHLKNEKPEAPPPRPPRLNNNNNPMITQEQQDTSKKTQLVHSLQPKQQQQQQFSNNCDTVTIDQNGFKSTRQLQEEVSRNRDHIKMSSCDDQILASKKLIEKSKQKVIEATAKAIAVNPSLAERLNTLLPQAHHNHTHHHHHLHNHNHLNGKERY